MGERIAASVDGLRKLQDAKDNKRTQDGKPWTYKRIADTISKSKDYISTDTVKRCFKGERVYRYNAAAIAELFGFTLEDILDPKDLEPAESEGNIDWREICQDLLEQHKWLTTTALTTRGGIEFKLDEVFVDLDLLDMRKTPNNDLQPSIKHNDFFQQVLQDRQSPKSQGRRIAIIGKAGGGKTTLLQKIGAWVLRETDNIPIWISLANIDISKKSLRDYLLQDWLRDAAQELETAPENYKNELKQLLKTGKVWLLLDGVDEMTNDDPLLEIASQINDRWLQNVRVVLTCRQNLWEGGKNALYFFDTYTNIEFDYPTKVYEFIDKWFTNKPDRGENLKLKLEETSQSTIRDIIKSPLLLTLLCYSWELHQGELPKTQLKLYEWFVDSFYEWNKGKVTTQFNLPRKELNQALSELALKAIDTQITRFCLRKKFVTQFLGDADDEQSLFCLAIELGWLNRTDVVEADPLQDVYSFLHPTFQEYFAALSIGNNWQFFLNHNPPNFDLDSYRDYLDKCIYRIFDSKYYNIFLMWIDLENVDIQSKNQLLESMILFEDNCNCWYFYWHRAYSLVCQGISHDNIHHDELYFGEILEIDEYGPTRRLDVDWVITQRAFTTENFIVYVFNKDLIFFNKQQILESQLIYEKSFYNKKFFTHQEEINFLLGIIDCSSEDILLYAATKKLLSNLKISDYFEVVAHLKKSLLNSEAVKEDRDRYNYCYEIIWFCSQKMSYPDFWKAWHNDYFSQKINKINTLPIGNSPIAEQLEAQQDICSQLQPVSNKIFCCLEQLEILVKETDIAEIVQELANQIFEQIAHNEPIPTINRKSDLKRELANLTISLQVEKIALIFDLCGLEINPDLKQSALYQIALWLAKSPKISIAWISDRIANHPLNIDPPMRGFISEQNNLLDVLQNWLNDV